MVTATTHPVARSGNGARPRSEERMDGILAHAAAVFCQKGYEGASMRDLSRATGLSLAGLYYYFESKEKLLYHIQKHTFRTIVERQRERLQGVQDPEQRLRVFILTHLEYFLSNQKAMKVLSHEEDVLKGQHGEEVRATKRAYYRMCVDLVAAAMRAGKRGASVESSRPGQQERVAALSLFGMMNWIYTWYNARVDADAAALAERMSEIFLHGVHGGAHAPAKRRRQRSRRKS